MESTIVAESNMRRRAANIDMEKVSLSENLKDVDRMAKKLQIDKETVIEVRQLLADILLLESNCKINGHMRGLLAKQKNRCNDTI